MEVYEVNGGNFRLQFAYKPFRESLKKFYADLLDDYQDFYPELEENNAFQRLRTS
jgi:ABC-type transporter MlaC component